MLRVLLIILLSVFGTSAGIWGGLQYAKTSAVAMDAENQHSEPPKREFLTPELFVSPVIVRNQMKGFLVCRLVLIVNSDKPAVEGISEELLMNELFLEIAFNNNAYVAGQTNVPDLSGVADAMLLRLNQINGAERYIGALIQQVDFFDREDVRRKVVQDRFSDSN